MDIRKPLVLNSGLIEELRDGDELASGVPGVPIVNLAVAYDVSIWDNAKNYVEISSATWVTTVLFLFRGTDIHTPLTWKIIASRAGTTGTSYYRLYDATNAQEIAYITKTSDAQELLSDSSLTNLPAGESLIEVQIKNDGSKSRLHYSALR